MPSDVETAMDPEVRARYASLADATAVDATARALEGNGMTVLRAENGAAAKGLVLDLVPPGQHVHHGASQTLEATGIIDAIENSGEFQPLRPHLRALNRETQAAEIRRLSNAPDVMLGSVHAVTTTGTLMAASMSGSQLGPYVGGAGSVIFVVGTQKIVGDVDEGLRRIYDYCLPLENARAQAAYGIRSGVNKILIINREVVPGRITVVLVDEVLGF